MNKEELLNSFVEDFNKSKGALTEVLTHNRAIDALLVEDLQEGDFKKLEEHIEITKLIVDGVKSFNDLYANAPKVIDAIDGLVEAEKNSKSKTSLKDIMGDLD
ncbi:MAG: hypothetical protein DRP93_06815 [Candidatus Neomarinimicrobiota bacterium]|nr:MAG: hypothetical protein DRP93_06815 [Candidatus Neomarinimicrobiota bacterium]